MAARLEGKGAGVMEMAGLAQKGGAVHIHCRIAEAPADITAIRVAVGEADAVIGGDIVVTAGAKTLGLMARGRTRAVVNTHEIPTGDFVRDRDFRLPTDRLGLALRARIGDDALATLDATRLAERLLGDSIFANVVMLGAAFQAGLVPLAEDALLRAIAINGAAVEGNTRAFALGRWAVAHPAEAAAALRDGAPAPGQDTLETVVETRAAHLARYQNRRLASRYRALVERAAAADPDLGRAVAKGYHRVLAYKDEYEVARLHAETLDAALAQRFDGIRRIRFHLAPPILARRGADGRPRKAEFGGWMMPVFRVLARLKILRGTPLDPFGRTEERRMERALIAEYEADLDRMIAGLTPETRAIAAERAALPLDIRGFGHVKAHAAAAAAERRAALMAAFDAGAGDSRLAAE
jgi:indolepyruvate ferredoxin oxidoreductase